ncbi:MAG: phenylalanine--tRNA ligase subunit alpha [Candidatus Acidiferrales bacterium]
MSTQPPTTQIDHLVEELRNAKDARLLQISQELLEKARGEVRDIYLNEYAPFLNKWFGGHDGIFWRAWNRISGRGKEAVVWSKRPLRELLLLPAEQIINLGFLSSEPDDIAEKFSALRQYFQTQAAIADDEEKFKLITLVWTSREGVLSKIRENWLERADPKLRPELGRNFNTLTAEIRSALANARAQMEITAERTALQRQHLDLSLPGVERPIGSRHLIRQTFEEIERIFLSLGYTVVEGPEIETPYYNFEALNIPEHHPARDTMDTFYLQAPPGAPAHLLRTHTSPMQVRTMEKQPPPVRIIVPGKVYRRDNPDSTHSFMFHQVEGLAVDTDITFCDFKGTIEYFVSQFFGPQVKTRLRPSYFPFTEPSAEFDATCIVCGGSGCRVCKFSGWIELFGAGMVDPAVYGFVKYDAKKLSGFAFGLGVDRLAMLKYALNDIQVFFQNDVRFLRQFP